MANLITGIISLSVSAVLMASLFLFTVHNTSTDYYSKNGTAIMSSSGTAWTGTEITMWGLLGLVAVVGLLYGVSQVFGIM